MILLSSFYFPNIQYMSKFLLDEEIIIEQFARYEKQSYRNRCTIAAANGKLDLVVPVSKPFGKRTILKDVLVDYDTKWQINHWRSIVSAYRTSPFFEIFEPELAPFFELNKKFLIDLNYQCLDFYRKALDLNIPIEMSQNYFETGGRFSDLRDSISPKAKKHSEDPQFASVEYYQVFREKNGFFENLSFLDLLFNEGPLAIDYLKKNIKKGS